MRFNARKTFLGLPFLNCADHALRHRPRRQTQLGRADRRAQQRQDTTVENNQFIMDRLQLGERVDSSDAMRKRPALTLMVEPVYASAADTRAIQTQRIRRDVAKGMGLKLAVD